ncbi:MAG: discoidin domain-containing protein, partial [Bacteroidaceae bacterium]|nr:discoidin domain-containing protein [Bacteroidaceae bacterium]
GADRRALGALIEQMEALTNTVATYNPTGTATEVTLTRTANSAGYIWSNADHNEHNSSTDGGGVAALIDGQANTYIHTNWNNDVTTITDDHFIQVNLGDGNAVSEFKFRYQARSGDNLGDYPKTIKIQGSTDGEKFLDIATVEPRNANGGTIENGAVWTSDVIGNGNEYTYLRFYVTATTSNRTAGGHIYWHMAEFDLYKVSASADVYTYLESAITNEQAAAAYDALVKAIRVYDNGTTAEEMQTAKSELQTAYDTLADLLKTAVPVTLTADEENPVLYKIFIKRTADVTVLKYDEATKQVAVVNTADNSSWQAWYFTGSENGVRIHPFNADGKVLAADNTSNNPAKVWAAAKGEKNFDEWKFVSRADGYYNIQARDGSNYFSNNGGTTNKMGFWSGEPDTDGGSLFKFVEAEFANNNARYYQLSDVKAAMIDGTNIYGGTSVGLYTGGKEYREAYTAAGTIVTAGNSSASDECYAAYKALREAKENLSYNEPDAEKLYVIKSMSTNTYCKGKYVHTYYTKNVNHNDYNHKNLVYHNYEDITNKALAVFKFEGTGTVGKYKMKNLYTGLYVKTFEKNKDLMGSQSEAQDVYITGLTDGQVTLNISNQAPMHAQQDYGVIVHWTAEANNASAWTIEEFTKFEDLTYTTTMSQLGYGTLMLGYDVNVP